MISGVEITKWTAQNGIANLKSDAVRKNPSNQKDGKPEPSGATCPFTEKNVRIDRCETEIICIGGRQGEPGANGFLKMVKIGFRCRKTGLFRANAFAFTRQRLGICNADFLNGEVDRLFGAPAHRSHLGKAMAAIRLHEQAENQEDAKE